MPVMSRKYAHYIRWIMFKLLRKKVGDYRIYEEALRGKRGLEIGGPSGMFRKGGIIPIYPIVQSLDGFGFVKPVKWGGHPLESGKTFLYCREKEPGYQFIGDAVDLKGIADSSYDFVLASHVLEHVANPIKAIREWLRVLRRGGALLLAVPDKEFIFDHARPVTSLEHLVRDFEGGVEEDDLTHLPEIVALTDIRMDSHVPDLEFLKTRGLCNYEHRCLHHHVFDRRLMAEIPHYLELQTLSVETAPPHHIITLARKP